MSDTGSIIEEEVAPEVEEDTTLANSEVVTKYQEAARIANAVLKELIALIVPGANALEVCKAGDRLIEEKLALIYRNKGKNGKIVDKGIAFPVCTSINEIVCHYSPLDSETAVPVIAANDMVKIDLGVHIDGYIATAAHTVFVKPTAEPFVVAGRQSDVVLAAYQAAEAAVRLIRPGNTSTQFAEVLNRIASTYGCQPISGSATNQVKRYVIEGAKQIPIREETGPSGEKIKTEEFNFEAHEVYTIDIAFSTGEGKPKDRGQRSTVFRRKVENKYQLKAKTARSFYSEIYKRFPTFPFTLRNISDEKNARLGLRELLNHDLIVPYPVLEDTKGDFIAHFKFTVLVMPNGTSKITGLTLADTPSVTFLPTPEIVLPEDILAVLALEEGSSKKKKKKAAKAAAESTA